MTSTTMYEAEVYTRVTLPEGKVSVRVLHTVEPVFSLHDGDRREQWLYNNVQILGVFRLDSDAEVDFKSLDSSDQQQVEIKCEHEYNKQR
jgi:hypothetical protein